MGRGAQRQVALAAEQARGGVHADPAGARQIDLRPGVQVGEVVLGSLGPLDRVDVGLELDQVAGDEPRGQAQPAQDLDQQPGAIAAGAGAEGQGLLRRLHARLHAHHIAHVALHPRVQLDQESDRIGRRQRQLRDQRVDERTALLHLQIGRQFGGEVRLVGEG